MAQETKKALLTISFGSSYPQARETIERIETYINERYSEHKSFSAFTSRRIISKLKERDGIQVDTPTQALGKICEAGYTHVVCQSLHVLNALEFDKTKDEVMEFRDSFEAITLGKPLLNGIEDYEHIAKLIREIACKHEAVLMMGHGTRHHSNAAYCMLEDYLRYRGIRNVYVATVEGFPVLEHAISKMRGDAVGKVTLMPFMIVAGDHAKNDMAGEGEDSWKSVLVSQGFEVDMQMSGLGDYEAVAELFYQHARNAEQIEQG